MTDSQVLRRSHHEFLPSRPVLVRMLNVAMRMESSKLESVCIDGLDSKASQFFSVTRKELKASAATSFTLMTTLRGNSEIFQMSNPATLRIGLFAVLCSHHTLYNILALITGVADRCHFRKNCRLPSARRFDVVIRGCP